MTSPTGACEAAGRTFFPFVAFAFARSMEACLDTYRAVDLVLCRLILPIGALPLPPKRDFFPASEVAVAGWREKMDVAEFSLSLTRRGRDWDILQARRGLR